ncbi:hypothetical protein GV794_26035 [Nocardia cyriacigeorgica]|uniref:DUF8020 domain-containing protein n=1 Tax=Nocardia cyriacigeorgica TaxID=135487 RepID=A0A6P1D7C3_9NOCA|nr:hypothetical protein [Nocardia cyriacigeorgica]NEW38686.1 hypothetical protein [Nocardia cyriacigeorgica]NEW46546.1 hypothetical protein [Nocardia cyriacigeorgica]NEW53406.1 hypothetical protein [Nocardia cyriacigeorgica]NEW59072.1 hypothetical protein [Nocardia cyriacigeorgica]
MKLRKSSAIAAMVTGAMAMGFGTAHAEPAAEAAQPISYSVKLVDKTVVTTLKNGTFELAKSSKDVKEDDVYLIKDGKGATVVSLPIAFDVADVAVPVKPVVKDEGKVLELTPDQAAVPAEAKVNTVNVAVKEVASPIENQRAQNEFASQFGIATAVGGFLGTAVGVIAGGVIGCILGLPFLGVGCIPAAIAGAGIGGILGTVAVGGPALAITGMDLINTLQAEPGTTKWTDENMKGQK